MIIFAHSLFVKRHFDSFLFFFFLARFVSLVPVTTDEKKKFTNFLGAGKDKIPRDQSSGIYSKDTILD